jgi:hypothetical protein
MFLPIVFATFSNTFQCSCRSRKQELHYYPCALKPAKLSFRHCFKENNPFMALVLVIGLMFIVFVRIYVMCTSSGPREAVMGELRMAIWRRRSRATYCQLHIAGCPGSEVRELNCPFLRRSPSTPLCIS